LQAAHLAAHTGTTLRTHTRSCAHLCPAGQQKARAKEASEAAHLELAKKVQTEVAGSGQQQYLLGNLAFSVPSSWTPDESTLTGFVASSVEATVLLTRAWRVRDEWE
jgi:hypothetical protein